MASVFFVSLGAGIANMGACIGNGIACVACAAVGTATAPYWIGAAAGGAACACGAVACYEGGCCGAITRQHRAPPQRGENVARKQAGVVKRGAPLPRRVLKRPVAKGGSRAPKPMTKNPLRAAQNSAAVKRPLLKAA